jgi:small conductance mechanosensitive channel
VRQTGLFACKLEAFDGLHLFVPNSTLWNVPLRNYTRNAGRLVSLGVTVPQKIDVDAVRKALLDLAAQDKRIVPTPAPVVFPEKFTTDTIVLNFRVWADHGHIGALQRELVEQVEKTVAAIVGEAGAVQVARNSPTDNDPTRLTEDVGGAYSI